jgi:hypothetical protein
MAEEPLGLAGRTADIPEPATTPPERKFPYACVRADKTVTTDEKIAAVAAVLDAARMKRRRQHWNHVE